MTSTNDRIEKKVVLRATRQRVWRAISDAREFGAWFGMKFDGPFVAGEILRGTIVPTQADADVAREQKPYEGHPFEIRVERIEPERLFSFRWHPFAVDRAYDYSREPMTLVEFTLEEAAGGVLVTVSESGFDSIPLERRSQAFTSNEQGWAHQVRLLEKYLAHAG
jgi:uncharacterized protein YndB with AHSA1/START domain